VSYHQKKFRCSYCKQRGRGVTYRPLMDSYLHYECWLKATQWNLYNAGAGLKPHQDYDEEGFSPEPNHPFTLTEVERRRQHDLFDNV